MNTTSITAICAVLVCYVFAALAETTTPLANSTTQATPTEDPFIRQKWWLALSFAVPISLLLVGVCVGRCVCRQQKHDHEDRQKLTNQQQEFEDGFGQKNSENAVHKL